MRGDQLARQWQLIQRLAKSRAGVNLDALAEDLGCVRRTVYRDLDALMYAGFPVVSERRDGRVYYRFLETFRLGNVPFTPDEMLALAFGEDLLRILEGTVFHDSIRSALSKIRAGLSPELSEYLARLGESFRVLPGPHKNYAQFRDTIQQLNDAVLRRRTVRMRYRTGRTGSVATRDLDPFRIWYRSGGLYAVGFDHRSQEIRTFAIDRIKRLEVTTRRFEVPADFDFDAYIGSSSTWMPWGVTNTPAPKAAKSSPVLRSYLTIGSTRLVSHPPSRPPPHRSYAHTCPSGPISAPAVDPHSRPSGSLAQWVITVGVGLGRSFNAGSVASSAGVPVVPAGGNSKPDEMAVADGVSGGMASAAGISSSAGAPHPTSSASAMPMGTTRVRRSEIDMTAFP